jgi:DNA-binding NtrC family response regulator
MRDPENDYQPFALVVDDEALILEDACEILRNVRFRPLEASNFAEAVIMLEEYVGAITLLFTDAALPGSRNGIDLAQEAAWRWPDIKTLVASETYELKDGDLPTSAIFVGKPFSAQVVYDRLQQLLPEGAKPEPLKKLARRKG